jgi:hypothetical protein
MRSGFLTCTSLVALMAGGVQAASVTYDFNFEFSGGTSPVGSAPWLRVNFDDGGSAGSVDMTFTAVNLTANEFVSKAYFNLDPQLLASGLVFSAPTKTGTFTSPTISLGTNAYQAGPDGLFDVRFDFATGGGANGRFGAGEAVKYTVSGYAGLVASSFAYLSFPSGGQGPFPVAAHVQSIGANGDSGWVTHVVPEPASFAAAFLALPMLRRRR